jgi:hypothetical protein
MREEAKEYSIAELLDHPGLGLVMTGDGIERRSLELMLDAHGGNRRGVDKAGDEITVSGV